MNKTREDVLNRMAAMIGLVDLLGKNNTGLTVEDLRVFDRAEIPSELIGWIDARGSLPETGDDGSFNMDELIVALDSHEDELCESAASSALSEARQDPMFFDLTAHLVRQREFSERTFGPGARTAGVIDHIRKELLEVEANPGDVYEWVDIVLLALDGAWRAGHTPYEIARAIGAKQGKNEQRTWPDWRTAEPGKAIEHDRSAGAADYDTWIKEGLRLYTLYEGSAEGLKAWHEWSSKTANYEPSAVNKNWDTFRTVPIFYHGKHDLYTRGDADAPSWIKGANGDITLGLCKRCGKGEAGLADPCIPNVNPEKDNG